MASTRLSFLLDGHDGLSRVLDRVGDNAIRLHRRFSAATTNATTSFNRLTGSADRNGVRITRTMTNNTNAVRGFTTDANGRLRDLRGRFLSAGDAARQLQGDVSRLNGPMRGAAAATGEASAAGGAMGPVFGGVAAVIGLSVLPALGALVPMMAGAGLAAGTLKLGFAGVGEAAALAGGDKKKYAEALKKLSPESRGLTKELVKLKKEFGDVGKDIQKVMLPGFTRALKDAKPVVDILGKGMVQLGRGFGEAARGAGRLFKSGGFQADLKTNLDLGMSFVQKLGGGFGSLLTSLLAFGAKSKPTLDAFANGLSGLLGKGGGGLAGMFKGLEVGIGGSAKFLEGFFSMLNQLLPAVGRFSGEVARAFGPLLGEMFKSSGDIGKQAFGTLGLVVKGLSPIFKDLTFGVRSVRDIFAIVAPVARDAGAAILGAFLPSFSEIDKARGPLQRLSDSIQANKGTIQEVARIMGNAFIDMAAAAIQHLPTVLGIFKVVTGGMVSALGGVIHGMAELFGFIPGIGDKLKSADESFAKFKDGFISGLGAAEQSARTFADNALPKLSSGQLKMNITSWNSQIETAKAKLKTVPPSKQAAVKANIADLQRKVDAANRDLATLRDRNVTVTTRYVVVGDGSAARKSGAHGSQLKAEGGLIHGPGTGTSDDVPIWASRGEFMVKAKSVAKYGVSFLKAVNEGRLNMGASFSGAGSGLAGAGQEAARGLSTGLRSSTAGVDAAARIMAAAVTAGVRAELQIASPSKKMQALMKDVGKGMILGLTGSKAKISAVAKDLVRDIWAAWKGTGSKKDSHLVAMVNRDTKKLQKLASERDALKSRIAAAKTFAKDITAGARQDAALGSLGIEQEDVSAGSIKGGLADKLAKLKTFTSYIKTLAKRGLNKSLLRQVLEMGPEQGYAYASALAGADVSTFKAINSLETQINHGADALGLAGADGMYDAGANAGKGFLKGLDSQLAAVEKQMVKIAKAMEKAIRKALGIKSPSTVAAVSGGFFTKGLGVGAIKELPFLDRAMDTVTGRMASARPVIGRPAVIGAGAGAGGVVYNIQVDVRDAMDPVAVGREIDRIMRRFERGQGR
ncbi:hypothetical protein [Streptomyces sp. NPDC001876]|uniref:hypothetical protein n=1 Tax=Streptomyces sp. NPDC001876 TaxID=3154402 RepID=UPI00332BEF59